MKKLNVKTIVFAAVLVAMNLVLSRVLALHPSNYSKCNTDLSGKSLVWTAGRGNLRWSGRSAGMSDPGICTESIDSGVFCVGRCDSCSI